MITSNPGFASLPVLNQSDLLGEKALSFPSGPDAAGVETTCKKSLVP